MADFGIKPDLALGLKPPPSISLADMINIARGVQAYQQAEQINPLALQQAQQATRTGEINLGVAEQQNAERTNLQRFFSDPENFQTSGRIDLNKVNKIVPQIAPLTGREIMKNVADLASAQSSADSAIRGLSQDAREKIASRLSIMGRLGISDPQIIGKELDNLVIEFGNDKNVSDMANRYKYILSRSGDTISPNDLMKEATMVLSVGQQEEKFAPKVGVADVGGQLRETITTPSVAGQAPRVEIGKTLAQKTLSPGTEITLTEGNQYGLPAGTKIFVGGTSGGATGVRPEQMGQPKTKQAATPLISSQAPQVSSTIAANTQVANEDWKKTSELAASAEQRIGIFQKIKKLAPEAFTGAAGDRRATAASILNLAGISAFEAEKVSTDELAKNTNLLTLAGGNTDAARLLAEAANPNKKMEKESIIKVADQLIGIEKMGQAKANYLSQFRNNPELYQSELQKFNRVADPRIFQETTPEEVAKLKKSMSKEEQKALSDKIRMAREMGLLR